MGIVVALAAAAVSLAALPEPDALPVSAAADSAQVHCLKALTPLAAGAIPAPSDFAPAACPNGAVAPAFAYDRGRGFSRLIRAVAANDIVPVYPHSGAGTVRPGQTLRLVIAYGPVRIERDVKAMQTARLGQRLFVKTGDGEILSVTYGGGAQ